jgi:hypothetical protein
MFSFKGRLFKNESSQNMIGIDLDPIFYVIPTELTEVVEVSNDSRSVERGFWKDAATGLFLRNMPDSYTKEEAVVDFIVLKKKPPYEAQNEEHYTTRMSHWISFHSITEGMWNEQIRLGVNPEKESSKLHYIELVFTQFVTHNPPQTFFNISDVLTEENTNIVIKDL